MAVSQLPRASEPREARQGHGGWGLRDLGRGERPQLPRGHRGRLREAGVQVREINAKTNANIHLFNFCLRAENEAEGAAEPCIFIVTPSVRSVSDNFTENGACASISDEVSTTLCLF